MSDTWPVLYTLTMGLLWFSLAFVIGLVTGILLRSVVARRQIAAARDGAELRRLQRRILELETQVDAVTRDDADPSPPDVTVSTNPPAGPRPSDEGAIESRLADDLTRIEGLGPAVHELCEGLGITTFELLAATDVDTLRSMLDDAGARYRVHDPTTWPTQARLLAEGRHDEFDRLAESIRRGGRSAPEVDGP